MRLMENCSCNKYELAKSDFLRELQRALWWASDLPDWGRFGILANLEFKVKIRKQDVLQMNTRWDPFFRIIRFRTGQTLDPIWNNCGLSLLSNYELCFSEMVFLALRGKQHFQLFCFCWASREVQKKHAILASLQNAKNHRINGQRSPQERYFDRF